MNKFKRGIGYTFFALSIGVAIANYHLQSTLDRWKSFPTPDALQIVGEEMWWLIPIIYAICLSFALIGIYIMYEDGAFAE